MEYLTQQVESLIFITPNPISLAEIGDCLEEAFGIRYSEEVLQECLHELTDRYHHESYAFEVVPVAGGWQFMTKGAYHHTVGVYLKQTTRKRLSRTALETLAIVAYKQPTTKSELEQIRGVNCDYALQKLLEKELIHILGRSDGPGRPLLYGTSEKFMDYFGLRSLADLPTPKELQLPENTIGQPEPLEEEE